jgi:L,D-peptidoglycan transpeptidase YkuD (ErfK/YbiS/YcfS/YnhG family)
MRFRPLTATLILIASAAATFAAPNPLSRSRQCLVVVAPDWNSTTGQLRAFERTESEWKMRGNPVRVVLGKNGLAWGRGLFDANNETGPRKMEGDNRVPAGIFRLGPAFGYAPATSARWIKLRYVPLTRETEGIDDPRSQYYNQLVERSKVPRVDWRSSEQMRRADELYKWGIFVAHNPTATPGAGSCIFMHIWRNSSAATAGCTAMPERDLVELLRWLDPAAHPLLVQMPQRDYVTIQSRYSLPPVADQSSR